MVRKVTMKSVYDWFDATGRIGAFQCIHPDRGGAKPGDLYTVGEACVRVHQYIGSETALEGMRLIQSGSYLRIGNVRLEYHGKLRFPDG